MTVYKHVTGQTALRILRDRVIRVTQPSALNDSLECRPPIVGLASDKQLPTLMPARAELDKMCDDELEGVLDQLQLSPADRELVPCSETHLVFLATRD